MDKTNNTAEIWHKHINKDLKENDAYKNLWKFINILKFEVKRQNTRYTQFLKGSLTSNVTDKSKQRYLSLARAVERYEKITDDTDDMLKLDWLQTVSSNYDDFIE